MTRYAKNVWGLLDYAYAMHSAYLHLHRVSLVETFIGIFIKHFL